MRRFCANVADWNRSGRNPVPSGPAARTQLSAIGRSIAHLRLQPRTVVSGERLHEKVAVRALRQCAFVLQFPSIGQGGYRGGYREANGVVAFAWEDWSPAGVWSATGALTSNTLTIRYNDIMYLTDFEDAVYVLGP